MGFFVQLRKQAGGRGEPSSNSSVCKANIPNLLHLIPAPKHSSYSSGPWVSPKDLLPWDEALRGAGAEWERNGKKGNDPERVGVFLRILTPPAASKL